MSEELNRKLTSMLEQAGIKIEGSDISVLNKKSYKLILSTKKNLKKSGVTIDTFIDLNTV